MWLNVKDEDGSFYESEKEEEEEPSNSQSCFLFY